MAFKDTTLDTYDADGNIKNSKENDDEYKPIIHEKLDIKVAIIMVILGTGYLFPFESYLLSMDYFTILYPQFNIYSSFPFIYMGAICITFLFFLKFPNFSSHKRRMLFGFSFYALIMVLVPIVNLTSIAGTTTAYIITLLLITATGVVDGFVQGTIYAIAGIMGPRYTLFTQTGVGLAGIIVVVTRTISKVSVPGSGKHGVLMFFLISATIILFCLLSFVYLLRLPIAKVLIQSSSDREEEKPKIALKPIVKATYQLGMMNFWIFFISMFIFPGVVLRISTTEMDGGWFAITLQATYNLFDFIGKTIPVFIHPDGKNVPSYLFLWILTIGRTVFVALFFLCVYTQVFNHIAWPIVFLIIFSFTNGYLCSVVVSEGPRKVKRDQKELAGIFMTTTLILGLTLGSVVNFIYSTLKPQSYH
ncbi:equilibrative nucleoside transporter family protein [Heterostelium album PN500]|uniref:Equilibrative nucleoside transporter family protein n=1 Tax=Heterostelium pallidum (strain ATCC 26659 / Pp 5 / PN500) TaxID=670386 RepID=D3B155_HETP5|nr:equilibrative nucleoside transporter family protein [Heterostelium album PN500]EFA85029.1 equilibrative nucleoside transporter family protein [Heterostelium album PN500]|eukprot:XP_020437139.1 equilibrative nucleoside transporter family protein [Heterostelium album PN500]